MQSDFDKSVIEADTPLSDYDQARARVRAMMQEVRKTADRPEVVAETVLLAARAKQPRRRYPAG
jgi:hypothetical protein